MTKTTDEAIARFVDHFSRHVEAGRALVDSDGSDQYRKLLYVAVLDALSRAAYPEIKKNGQRFLSFIRDFSDWRHHHRISLPHLAVLLESYQEPAFVPLHSFVRDQLQSWQWGDEIVSISRDPDWNTVAELWPTSCESKPWQQLEHASLLYRYRNSLVHELRTPSSAEPVQLPAPEAIYVSTGAEDALEEFQPRRRWWSLSYPARFFESLCSNSLTQLQAHLIAEARNPYDVFRDADYWI